MGEGIFKISNCQGIHNQNIKRTPTNQFIKQKQLILKNKWKTWTELLQKKICEWPMSVWNNIKGKVSKKIQIKITRNNILYPPDWQKFQSPIIPNVGEDVE